MATPDHASLGEAGIPRPAKDPTPTPWLGDRALRVEVHRTTAWAEPALPAQTSMSQGTATAWWPGTLTGTWWQFQGARSRSRHPAGPMDEARARARGRRDVALNAASGLIILALAAVWTNLSPAG